MSHAKSLLWSVVNNQVSFYRHSGHRFETSLLTCTGHSMVSISPKIPLSEKKDGVPPVVMDRITFLFYK